MFAVTWPIANREYVNMFVRDSPEKWARANSCPENEEHTVMFEAGLSWGREQAAYRKEETIVHDGLKLAGEYFDFGFDRCVIILPGRAESLLYGYYFAEPFQKLGYNILVIDQRAHGESEGVYNCVGIREREDVSAWMDHIRQKYGIEHFVIHGICIGSSIAITLGTRDIPWLKGVVLEGPYISFHNVLIQRTKAAGKPVFPFVEEITWLLHKKAEINILKEKPLNYVKKMHIPVLFLCGRQDYSSRPEKSEKLFRLCGSEEKRIVWFEKGAHSHLRIQNQEEYDRAVTCFIKELVR